MKFLSHFRGVWLISFFVLYGCAVGPQATPSLTSIPESGPLDAESLPLPEGAVISYRRSGGIAGLDETWLVYADGRIVDPKGLEHSIDPAQVNKLLEKLNKAHFFDLDPAYQPETLCCDRFTYELIVRFGNRANRMMAVDGVENVPPELWTCLELVQGSLDANLP